MRLLRKLAALGVAALFGAIAALLAIYIATVRAMPDLAPWHEPLLERDFRASDTGEDLAAYLAREARIFDELEQRVAAGNGDEATATFSRYVAGSPSNPELQPRDWNRTFLHEAPEPKGGVLLLHGLSDSPYTTRTIGEIFREHGFTVLGLRVPGHGTSPGELRRARWDDWREAVRLAARHVVDQSGRDRPFFVVGYSNGGALAIDYALDALENPDDPPPTRLVLVAPAIAVSPVAALASFQLRLSAIPGLEKLAWTSILPEYDPFKYNSFPVSAGEQIHRLTTRLERRLAAAHADGRLAAFPPTLVFQSVVDATIPPQAIVDRLLARLPPNGSELVLFDVNRLAAAEDLLRTRHDAFLSSQVEASSLPYALTVLTNAGPDTQKIVARHREAGSSADAEAWSERPLALEWPRGVYSLSHLALPVPVGDRIYGVGSDDDDPTTLHLGSLELRGERGVFGIPMDQLMRLRYNPFFPYLRERIEAELANPGS